MTLAYLVQHGEKEPLPGDPGLTGTGREQATRTGRRLRDLGISALFSSPMRRARETAEGIASVTGLEVSLDARLRERLNWDGSLPFDAFLALWARTMRDRDWVPPDGESSRQAGTRLREFLAGLAGTPGPVAVVTHGGITLDLLRNLLGDDAVPPPVLTASIPPCAVTALDDLSVVTIASVAHLDDQLAGPRPSGRVPLVLLFPTTFLWPAIPARHPARLSWITRLGPLDTAWMSHPWRENCMNVATTPIKPGSGGARVTQIYSRGRPLRLSHFGLPVRGERRSQHLRTGEGGDGPAGSSWYLAEATPTSSEALCLRYGLIRPAAGR